MKLLPCYLLALACTALIITTPAMSAEAAMDAPGGQQGEHGPGPGFDGPGMSMHGGRGRFRDLGLTEAQEQKAFAIHHAAEPLMFEQSNALRKAHETLRALGESPQFDEAKAAAAASAAANASAAMALSHARVASQMMALLTPEQRAKLAERRPPHRR
ncbi:MAG: Spy/CpxP family protein refolding chaperone [Massilia sp.]